MVVEGAGGRGLGSVNGMPGYGGGRWTPEEPREPERSEGFLSKDEVDSLLRGTPMVEKAHTFLEEAGSVMKQRAALRDKPEGERSMAAIVKSFNALTGHTLNEAEGWEFMILLKMVRGRQGNYNRDDYVDGAAYFGLLGECKSGEKK